MAESTEEVIKKLRLINAISENDKRNSELATIEQHHLLLNAGGDAINPKFLENKLEQLKKMKDHILTVQNNIDTIKKRLQHPEVVDALHVHSDHHRAVVDSCMLVSNSANNSDKYNAAIDSVIGTDFQHVERQVVELKACIQNEFTKLDNSISTMKEFHNSLNKASQKNTGVANAFIGEANGLHNVD